MQLLTNPSLNGLASFILTLVSALILIPVLRLQIQQYRVRRLLFFKTILLVITASAIILSIPSMVLQLDKVFNGSFSLEFSYITSLTNALSRFALALGLTVIYLVSNKEK